MTISYDIETFYAGLVEHGLIIPTGMGGYGSDQSLRTYYVDSMNL